MTVLAIILISIGSWSAAAGPVTLHAPVNVSIGANPLSVISGDFNGDGKLDAASANFSNNAVGVRFGDGQGGFAPPASYPVGAQPLQIITGHFNGDTFLDLATANKQDNNITVLLNNGAGVFTATSYAAGVGPSYLDSADFNNDGRADIVTASNLSQGLAILLANAGGGFDAPALIALNGSLVQGVAAGLVNADANVDLVTVNPGLNNISLLTGNGSGGFAAPVNFSTGANTVPTTISLGDFNGDSKLDALAGTSNNNKLNFMAGNGLGSFTLAASFNIDNAVAAVLRDVDGDGKLDIVSTCYNNNFVRVMYGNGSGGVAAQNDILSVNHPRATAIGDFNGDGRSDLVTVSETTGSLSTALSRGARAFPTAVQLSTQFYPPKLADLNADGKLDFVSGGTIRLGNGNGTFGAAQTWVSFLLGSDYEIGDVNNDNRPDVVISGNTLLSIMINDGNGGFNVSHISTQPGQIGLGDFNYDGKVDIVVALPATAANNLRIFHGDGMGGFTLGFNGLILGGTTSLQVADMSNDGRPDLVIRNAQGVNILLGDGPNSFIGAVYVGDGGCQMTQAPAIADFNRDGKLDLAGAINCGNGLNAGVFVNNGTGGYLISTAFMVPLSAGDSTAADLNRDGYLDLAVMGLGELGVAYGSANGQFTVTSYAAGGTNVAPTAGDVTGDGIPDILFAYTNPAFTPIHGTYMFPSAALARGKTTADFDGDGRTDISVFRPSTGIWYIIRSSDHTFYGVQFGQNGDLPVPGDYDADGRTDLAVFRPSSSVWYVLRSADGSFFAAQHGTAGDIPVPADYNGDGATNIAVYRPSTGFWYTSTNPATSYDPVQFGTAGDIPTQADYDGDGRADVAVFRPSTGVWYSLRTSEGFQLVSFGLNGDRPAPLDYDGDGKANVALFRPSNATWYTSMNPATNFGAIQWGLSSDVMVPGYYDGDARADVGVYRTGDWYVLNTATPTYDHFYFGAAGDIPIPLAYIPQ